MRFLVFNLLILQKSPMILLLLSLVCSTTTLAGDWPQLLGPQRNGHALGESLATQWSAEGPKKVWSVDLGSGFSGPAVVGNQVVMFHRVDAKERIESFDVRNGKSNWSVAFEATYRGSINPDSGPRCVPLIHAGRVYVFGAAGDLHCVELKSGAKQWSRSLYEDVDGDEGYFGAGSTPIIIGDQLLVNAGGRNAGIVAISLKTGKTIWQATREGASYSSPTLATLDGQDYAVFVTRLNAVGLDPQNGDVRFSFPFGRRGPTVNAATPLVFDNYLFISSSYGIGASLSDLRTPEPKPIWANDTSMSSQYCTAVFQGGYLYGTHGREDGQAAELRCIEAKSGKIQWSEQGFGVAHTILADKLMLLLNVEGQLSLVKAQPTSYAKLAEATISQGVTRAIPALSNGKLFLRNNIGNSGSLHCFAVGK